MLQGQLDMNGAVVDLIHHPERPGLEWVLKIVTSTACTPLEVALQSRELVSCNLLIVEVYLKRKYNFV